MAIFIFSLIILALIIGACYLTAKLTVEPYLKKTKTISVTCPKCGGTFDINPEAALSCNEQTNTYLIFCPLCTRTTAAKKND